MVRQGAHRQNEGLRLEERHRSLFRARAGERVGKPSQGCVPLLGDFLLSFSLINSVRNPFDKQSDFMLGLCEITRQHNAHPAISALPCLHPL